MTSQNDQKQRRPIQPTKAAWTAAVIKNIEAAWIEQGHFYGSVVGELVADYGVQRGYRQAVDELFEVVGEDFWQSSPDEPIGRFLTEQTREGVTDKRAYDISAAIVKGHHLAFKQFGIDAPTKGTRFLDEIETIISQGTDRAAALSERAKDIDLVLRLVKSWTATEIDGSPTPGDLLQSRLSEDAQYWKNHAMYDDVNPYVVKGRQPTIEDVIREAYEKGLHEESEPGFGLNSVLSGINFTRWTIEQKIKDNQRISSTFPNAIAAVFPPKPIEDEPAWVQDVFAAYKERRDVNADPKDNQWLETRYEFEVWRNTKGLTDADRDPLGSLPPADFQPEVGNWVITDGDREQALLVGQERYNALFDGLLKVGNPIVERYDFQPTIYTTGRAESFSTGF